MRFAFSTNLVIASSKELEERDTLKPYVKKKVVTSKTVMKDTLENESSSIAPQSKVSKKVGPCVACW